MTAKKGIILEEFLDSDAKLPYVYKEILSRGIKSPVDEHELILRLLSITAYQSIKISELEREIARVKEHLPNQTMKRRAQGSERK